MSGNVVNIRPEIAFAVKTAVGKEAQLGQKISPNKKEMTHSRHKRVATLTYKVLFVMCVNLPAWLESIYVVIL